MSLNKDFVNIRVPKSMAEALMDAEDDVTTVSLVPTVPPPAAIKLPPVKVGKLKWIEPTWAKDVHYALTAPKHHKIGGCMLFGPRGTGKTMAVEQITKRLGLEHVAIGCCKGMMYEDWIGSKEFNNGKTEFIDGPLTEAVRKDCIFYCEEVNNVTPGQCAMLNPLIDGSGLPLVLPNGERLEIGPGFKVILCFNPNYSGTMEINESLKDRLHGIDTVYMAPEDERDALMANVPELPEDIATSMIAIANGIRAAASEFGFDLSIRSLMQWANVCLSDITQYTWEEGFKKVVCGKMGTAQENGEIHAAVIAITESMGIKNLADTRTGTDVQSKGWYTDILEQENKS